MASQFSPSWRILTGGVLSTVVGCFMILIGLTYQDAAKHEATATGVIVRVYHGKSTTYYYEFRVNGTKMSDSTGTCKTPLTNQFCQVGAPVRVYYTYEPTNDSMLEDFADAARAKLQVGTVLSAFGLVLMGISWLVGRYGSRSKTSEEGDDTSNDNDSEVISIAPKD